MPPASSETAATCPEPSQREAFVLRRVGTSDPSIRLACQLRPGSDLSFFQLFLPHTMSAKGRRREDYLKFVASGILGVFSATTTLVALSYFVEVFVAKLVSILVGFAANFSMSHFVVFRPKGP